MAIHYPLSIKAMLYTFIVVYGLADLAFHIYALLFNNGTKAQLSVIQIKSWPCVLEFWRRQPSAIHVSDVLYSIGDWLPQFLRAIL